MSSELVISKRGPAVHVTKRLEKRWAAPPSKMDPLENSAECDPAIRGPPLKRS